MARAVIYQSDGIFVSKFIETLQIAKIGKVHDVAIEVFQQGVASADGLNSAPNHTDSCMHGAFLWIMY
jgi:hypothetical protein